MTFIEDIKKPINYISLIIGIAAFISGFFFYYNSQKTKAISYHIDEPSSLIYDSKNASSTIKVIEKDSIPIKDNVYILTGTIWNSGNETIKNEDVRQNLSLVLMSAKEILDFKIVNQTDPLIAKFALIKKDNKSLNISWKYFDPGYGFNFQVIYTGRENSEFTIDGKILDVGNFKKVISTDKTFFWVPVFCLVTLIITGGLKIMGRIKYQLTIPLFDLLVPIVLSLMLLFFFFLSSNHSVPVI